MNVLLLGSHRGYNLEHYASIALDQLGCKVVFVGHREFLRPFGTPLRMAISRSRTVRRVAIPLGLKKYNESIKAIGDKLRPEIVLSIKGEAVLPSTIDWFRETVGTSTALWYPDDPRYFRSLSSLIAPHYDFVFTAAKGFVTTYQDLGVHHCAHLPFGCEPMIHRRRVISTEERRIVGSDVCFVGMYSLKRDRIIRALENKGLNVGVWGPFWRYFRSGQNIHGPVVGAQLAKVFSGAKVVLNIHDDGDLGVKANMRTFEAAGCQSVLLTDNSQQVSEYFEPQKEVSCYSNILQIVESTKRYEESSEEGESQSARAKDRAYREHTYRQRLKVLLNTINA